MTKRFEHVLLTRFNIYMGEALGPPARRLEDQWLQSRLKEFETFCLPSVLSQSTQNFRWLVFCDPQSPPWFKEQIRSFPKVEAIFRDDVTRKTAGEVVDSVLLGRTEFLISTRLDNDDAIASDYMEQVQRRFASQHRLFLDFPRGVRAYRGGLYSALWRSNPFMSMIERRQPERGFETVFAFQHDLVRRTEPIQTVWTGPAWLRSMHEANTVTTAVGIPRLRARYAGIACRWQDLPHPEPLVVRVGHSLRGYVMRLLGKRKVRRIMAMMTPSRRAE